MLHPRLVARILQWRYLVEVSHLQKMDAFDDCVGCVAGVFAGPAAGTKSTDESPSITKFWTNESQKDSGYETGPYRYERLNVKSHWLLEECSDEVATLILNRVKDA
jgi:hypothetical protein